MKLKPPFKMADVQAADPLARDYAGGKDILYKTKRKAKRRAKIKAQNYERGRKK